MIINKANKSLKRSFILRMLLFCLIFDLVFSGPLLAEISKTKKPAVKDGKYFNISPDDVAKDVEKYGSISPFDMAVEPVPEKVFDIGPDDVAQEVLRPEADKSVPIPVSKGAAPKAKPGKIAAFAKNFWDETEKFEEKTNLSISGTKSFEMKKADVSGDIGHFSTENFDSMPGFHLDQSLHLEIEGNITENSTVHAVLDDKDDEDRRFTINIDGPVWDFVMGDFPLAFDDTEFTLFRKEVRGILAKGAFHHKFDSAFLFSQSKGMARREQFRGAGQQQEFRLLGSPVVQSSERVSIDGVLLARGTDYFVDYEDGIIKFLPHVLPIELTRWIVVEYEVADEKMAFSRNLFGTRQVYKHAEGKKIGLSWLREVDNDTPKDGDNASGTATPMQHDVIGMDTDWKISKNLSMKAESSMSIFDPNKNSDLTEQDKSKTGYASKLSLIGTTKKANGEVSFKRIDKDFKIVGREGGVTQLGERGLVNDILSGKARLNYQADKELKLFGDAEKSETNLSDDPTLSSIDFKEGNVGAIWNYKPKSRVEVRYGEQYDEEKQTNFHTEINRGTAAVVWDTEFKKINSQAKLQKTAYDNVLNPASDSQILQMDLNLGSEISEDFTWNVGASRVAVDDRTIRNKLRSETSNYDLDVNYEPNRVFTARGIFQWRREDDFLTNSRKDTEIADSRLSYRPNRDLRTQLKYKVENTSKVLRDPNLDPEKYIRPPSLPNSGTTNPEDILGRFENPVQKTTANFITDYQINKYLQAYFDWRRRTLEDQTTDIFVSTNDRKTYELRYSPSKNIQITTEYEDGVNKNYDPKTELRDTLKLIQIRQEFYRGCILDATYEERDEDDVYINDNDKNTKSKILDFQRQFNRWATMELGLQHNTIAYRDPSKEWEKRLAVILTPFSRSQRYKFFLRHKDIEAKQSGTFYEGGLNFSQFIGTDTIIDGEVKQVHSSPGMNGNGYDAFVFNAKMVITF